MEKLAGKRDEAQLTLEKQGEYEACVHASILTGILQVGVRRVLTQAMAG